MSFKHILVPLFGLDSDRTALDAALAIARANQGHIQALHAVADPLKTTPLMVDVGVAIAEVVAAAERHAEARSTQAKSAFDGWLRPLLETPARSAFALGPPREFAPQPER